MTRYVLLAWLLIIAVLTAPAFAGNCGHFFAHKQAVVVQQVVAAPIVYYSVGESLLIEAAVEKAFQRRELRQQQSAQHAPPSQPGTLAATGSVLSAKCARCHVGETAKGGIDFTRTIDAVTFRRSVELMGTGRDAPSAMKAVLAGLTPAEKGALMEELLTLSAKQEPPVAPPDPFQEQSGVLR